MLLCVLSAGLFQFGAPSQSRPMLTTIPLQVTTGGIIAMPSIPVEGTAAQASVYVAKLELLTALKLELDTSLSPTNLGNSGREFSEQEKRRIAQNPKIANTPLFIFPPAEGKIFLQ
jgi:hypothetical protein